MRNDEMVVVDTDQLPVKGALSITPTYKTLQAKIERRN